MVLLFYQSNFIFFYFLHITIKSQNLWSTLGFISTWGNWSKTWKYSILIKWPFLDYFYIYSHFSLLYSLSYFSGFSVLRGWLVNVWEEWLFKHKEQLKRQMSSTLPFCCWRKIKQDGNFHWIEIFKLIPAVTMWSASTVFGPSAKHIWLKYFRGEKGGSLCGDNVLF